jgi:hypothetical protein
MKVEAKDLEITGVYKGLLRGELAWAILQDKN